jgi:hypothetical protein
MRGTRMLLMVLAVMTFVSARCCDGRFPAILESGKRNADTVQWRK